MRILNKYFINNLCNKANESCSKLFVFSLSVFYANIANTKKWGPTRFILSQPPGLLNSVILLVGNLIVAKRISSAKRHIIKIKVALGIIEGVEIRSLDTGSRGRTT